MLQTDPQDIPSQVAVAFAGVGQAVHELVPQLEVLVFEAQLVPHLW